MVVRRPRWALGGIRFMSCEPAVVEIGGGVGFVACVATVAEIWGGDDLRWRRFGPCDGTAQLRRLGFRWAGRLMSEASDWGRIGGRLGADSG